MDTRLKVVIGHKYIRMDRRFEEKCVDFRNERRWIPSRDHLKMLSCHLVYKNAFTKYLGVVCTCCSRGDHPSHLIKFCQRPNNNSQSIVNFPLQWLNTFTLRPERHYRGTWPPNIESSRARTWRAFANDGRNFQKQVAVRPQPDPFARINI